MLAYLLLRWSGVGVFVLLWEMAPRLGWIDPYFVPAFSDVVREIVHLLLDDYLGIHIVVSVWRAVVGLSIACLVGVPLGLALGRLYPRLGDALGPLLRVLSQVNPFSLLPVFVLFFGIGEVAKLSVVGWVSLWPVLFYTMTATRNVDPVQEKSAASMGISLPELLLKVILPAALPTIFVGIRIGATITFYILVASEMLGASAGLGFLVHNAAMNYQIPRIYAGATFIVIFGYLLNRFLIRLEGALFAWREDTALPSAASALAPVSGWRPGRGTAWTGAAALVAIVVFGGIEVRNVNREAASVAPGAHSRHFGTPVDGGGN
ncbi:ABC transporter permease [Geomesophilobacter sediminis]|uniref:ABC transporter permease n=1 Tax=Geomesophilobacter sediminis TaxID=2798584 RepID=A0A8J7LU71_9BACT|nr:ABC transporter permease [Geomesophilobacter sediminis]MBJ6724319.1 ABC transporter permease [Geomesophilobacter sediminis]